MPKISIYLSIHTSARPSVHHYIIPSIHMPSYPPIYPCIQSIINLSIHPPTHPSIHYPSNPCTTKSYKASLWSRTAHLPNWVCVFAVLGCAAMHRAVLLLHNVEHSHTAIVETCSHLVGMVRVDVQAHHPAVCLKGTLRVGRVLQGVEDNQAIALLHEVICEHLSVIKHVAFIKHLLKHFKASLISQNHRLVH